MLPPSVFVILAAGWALWAAPFLLLRKRGERAVKKDRRARWGVVLQGIGYAVLWFGPWWMRAPDPVRVAAGVAFFAGGVALSWGGVRALGKQWRIDAGLNAEHELVRSGPYQMVRHPIYASMLCMFLASGLLVASMLRLGIGLLVFLAGIEIRVRVEDALLASRFGKAFDEYRRAVPAYIPMIR